MQSIPVDRASIVRLQDEQHVGFKSMVDDILQAAAHHLEKLNQASASPARPPSWWWACTAVAATRSPALPLTPLSATPLTCWCAAAGGDVLEVTDVHDAIHLLTPRAINEEVGRCLLEEMA